MKTKLITPLIVMLTLLLVENSPPIPNFCTTHGESALRPAAFSEDIYRSGLSRAMFVVEENDGGETVLLFSSQQAAQLMVAVGSASCPLVCYGAHPDDIEWATAGLQRRLLRQGRGNIYWGVSSAGVKGVLNTLIPDASTLSPGQLVEKKREKRIGETENAALAIGIPKERINFFGTLKTKEIRVEMYIAHLKRICEGLPPGAPIAVAWNIEKDSHPTHVHCARVIKSAVLRFVQETGHPVIALRFTLFSGNRDAERPNVYLLMGREQGVYKRDKVLSCHNSQTVLLPELIPKSQKDNEANRDDARRQFPAGTPLLNSPDSYGAERFEVYMIEPKMSAGTTKPRESILVETQI